MSDPLVLAAWLDALISGRRVALLGDSASGLAERLAQASGRLVHCYDPDRARTAESLARSTPQRSTPQDGADARVSFAPLGEAQDAHSGAFDAVVIADLGAFEQAEEILDLAQGLLSSRGFIALASENASGEQASDSAIGYYELYDLLSERFEHVRMLGQAPFYGATLADFAADAEPGVTIDTSLVDVNEEPSHFVALAGERPVEVDPYVLVQLPRQVVDLQSDARSRSAEEAALAEAKLQTSVLSTELERARTRVEEAERIATERRGAATQMSARLAELEAQREADRRSQSDKANAEQRERERTQQKRTHELERLLRDTQQQLDRVRSDQDRREREAADAQQEDLDKMLERIGELEGELEGARAESAPASFSETLSSEDTEAHLVVAQDNARALQSKNDELEKALAKALRECERLRPRATHADEVEVALAKALSEGDRLRPRAERTAAIEAELADALAKLELNRGLAQQAPPEGDDAMQARAQEIDALEARLRGRAKVIDKLRSDMREGERIGRELVREIEARAQADNASAASAGSAPSAGEIDTLLERCSRYEADLEAGRWKIASLSSQLDQQAPVATAPGQTAQGETDDNAKLEQALRQAHDELAALRTELSDD